MRLSLASPTQYKHAMRNAGFTISTENNRRDFALASFNKMRSKTVGNGGPPPLGIHTLLGESSAVTFRNLIGNIVAGYIAPVEIIALKH